MRYGIPLLGRRVAPRITTANSILLVRVNGQRVTCKEFISLDTVTWFELLRFLTHHHIDALVCGGIDEESKGLIMKHAIEVIENVACTLEEALEAIEKGALYSGFGFQCIPDEKDQHRPGSKDTLPCQPGSDDRGSSQSGSDLPGKAIDPAPLAMDCIRCRNRVCMEGRACPALGDMAGQACPVLGDRIDPRPKKDDAEILEAANDISLEEENILCRISELVYFCLEMDFSRLGVAFCAELMEPAEILTELLRRHFAVIPVICKVGGARMEDPLSPGLCRNEKIRLEPIACNPLGQAAILNQLNTDINIIVGLCMGVDCLFTKASKAPVTTLFVKDRSLANNPINALYSEYYRKEVKRTSAAISEIHDPNIALDVVNPHTTHDNLIGG